MEGSPGSSLFDMILARTFKTEYVHQEYPKWVNAHGKDVLVANEDEENALLGVMPKSEPDERETLLAQAKELGMKVHPATKTDKLREKVAAFKE